MSDRGKVLKVAYVSVERFAVEVERRARPELRGKAVVIGGLPHERRVVYDASIEASREGVRRGMALHQAAGLCPEAVFLPLDSAAEERYAHAREEFLELLEGFSPAVEPEGDGAYLDASGLTLLFGEDRELAGRIVRAVERRLGLAARVGIGPGKFVAQLAARLARSAPIVVEESGARAFLARQPAWLLPLGPSGREWLESLGVRTIGEFAQLPREDLAAHLGNAGPAAHRIARGEEGATVVARPRPATLAAAREVDGSLDLERLARVVARLLEALTARLRREGRSCRRLTLRLDFEDGTRSDGSVEMRAPTTSPTELTRAALRLAEEVEQAEAVVRIEVCLEGLGGQPVEQLGLFDGQRRRKAALDRAVGQIQRRFGDRVKRVVVAEPEAWLPARQFGLKDY